MSDKEKLDRMKKLGKLMSGAAICPDKTHDCIDHFRLRADCNHPDCIAAEVMES